MIHLPTLGEVLGLLPSRRGLNDMSIVKTIRVKGELKMGLRSQSFTKDVRALKIEEAREMVLSEMGSRNKLKRNQIKILSVEEIDPQEAQNPTIRILAGVGEDTNE